MTVSQLPQAGSTYKSILVSQNCDTQASWNVVHNNNSYYKWPVRFTVNSEPFYQNYVNIDITT